MTISSFRRIIAAVTVLALACTILSAIFINPIALAVGSVLTAISFVVLVCVYVIEFIDEAVLQVVRNRT